MKDLQFIEYSYRKNYCFYKKGKIFHKKKYWHLRRKVKAGGNKYYISARQFNNYNEHTEWLPYKVRLQLHKSCFENNFEIMIFKNDCCLNYQWRLKYKTTTKRLFRFLLFLIKKEKFEGTFKDI